MSSKNALFLLPDLQGGGAERVTLNVVSGIAARSGHAGICMLGRVIIAHKMPGNLTLDKELLHPKSVVQPKTSRIRLVRLLRQVVACKVIVGALEIKTHLVAVCLGFVFRRPILLWLHKDLRVFLARKGLIARYVYKTLFSINLYFSHKIVVVSVGAANSLAGVFPGQIKKIICIHNPVDFPETEDDEGAGRHPWLNGEFILGVGRLVWEKGFDVLIESFFIISDNFPELKLVILGEGEMRLDLERKIERLGLTDRVLLPGFWPPSEAMARAKVVVMSSRSEGLPTVLIEALHRGSRIVSTDCPSGPMEVLCAGKFGTLVPVDEPAELARGIVDMLVSDDNERSCSARRARAMDFSSEEIIPQWMELISSIAEVRASDSCAK